MPTHKPTELSRIKLKTWTRQPVPMMSEHSAHLTSLPFGFRTWLWRYTCLLLLISMLWHRQAIFESKGDKLSSSAESRIRTWKSQRHLIANNNKHIYIYTYIYIYYICLNVYVFRASICLHQLGSESVRQLPRWRWISHFSPKRVYQLVGYLFRCILGSNAMFVVYHIRTFTLLKTAVHNEYVNRLS